MLRNGRRALLAAGLAAIVLGSFSASGVHRATAALTANLECTAGADLEIVTDRPGHYLWTLAGGGQCGDGNAVYTAHIDGAGTSVGLGLCDSGIVTNLDINVLLTLTSTVTGVVSTHSEDFEAQLTTFPIATPFTVVQNFNTVGVGNIDTHIFLHCPPGGTPSTFLVWDQLESI